MRIRSLSINQLYALREILKSRSLTVAADRCASTQPGMSIILKKLRNVFEDELLIQNGNQMTPTYYGEGLLERLDKVFDSINQLKPDKNLFDYLNVSRKFTIATPSFLEKLVAQHFLDLHNSSERSMTFELLNFNSLPSANQFCEENVDIMLNVLNDQFTVPEELEYIKISSSDMAYCMSSKHGDTPLNIEEYLESSHIVLKSNDDLDENAFEKHLKSMKFKRHIAGTFINCDSMLQAQQNLSKEKIVINLPKFVLDTFKEEYDINIFPLPINSFNCHLALLWHKKNSLDPGLIWLKKELQKKLMKDTFHTQ